MMLAVTPIAAANFAPSPRPASSSVRLIQASDSFAFPKPPAVEALPVYRETRTADGLQVCGEIRSNTVWTVATGVYTVTCDVHVIAGAILRIQPGVAVRFQHAADDLIVSGALQAVGTAAAPIRFEPTSGTTPGSWGRVAFLAGSTGVLDHTRLTYGGYEDGMLYLASERVQVLHSLVQSSADTGIVIQTPAQGLGDSLPGRGAGAAIADQTAAPSRGAAVLGKAFLPAILADRRGIVPPSGPVISHTDVVSNTGVYGGGLYNESGSPIIQGNTFAGNGIDGIPWAQPGLGGGLYNGSGSPIIRNNTFSGNTAYSATSGGGGLASGDGAPVILNNVFVDNVAPYGGGLSIERGSPAVDYNDLWNNTGGDYVGIAAGLHDMAVDSLFVDAAAGDFHLAAGSPLIDAGDPTQCPPTDFDGDARPLGVGPDVGVDEFRPPPASPSP